MTYPEPVSGWTYGRAAEPARLEQAMWRGDCSPSLWTHFHDEQQLTMVVAGRRAFATPFGRMAADAGETLIFSSGLPHQAVKESDVKTTSRNIYLPRQSGADDGPRAIVAATPDWLAAGDFDTARLRRWVRSALEGQVMAPGGARRARLVRTLETGRAVSEIAAAGGMTRGGYIRAFRSAVGMTPHAYRLATRLNEARGLLRADFEIADAAVAAGFSDQSHLGRLFRRAFGVTPGAYRRAIRTGSLFFQTSSRGCR